MTKDAFQAACGTMGFEKIDPMKLFELIDYDRSGSVSLDEIDYRASVGLKEDIAELMDTVGKISKIGKF